MLSTRFIIVAAFLSALSALGAPLPPMDNMSDDGFGSDVLPAPTSVSGDLAPTSTSIVESAVSSMSSHTGGRHGGPLHHVSRTGSYVPEHTVHMKHHTGQHEGQRESKHHHAHASTTGSYAPEQTRHMGHHQHQGQGEGKHEGKHHHMSGAMYSGDSARMHWPKPTGSGRPHYGHGPAHLNTRTQAVSATTMTSVATGMPTGTDSAVVPSSSGSAIIIADSNDCPACL